MQQRDSLQLFERFREHGDTAALGEAFDLAAPDLRAVARHLARDRHEADDLVQATFLTAIEKVRTFEPGRDPVPWLVGILTMHARNRQRKHGRDVELAGSEATDQTTPDLEVERAEFTARVRAAVAGLPDRYSSVLAPYLAGEQSSHRIALATGRSPATVRMQVHRGLSMLRRSLANLSPFGAWIEARRLATLRRVVLERAARTRGLPVPVASSSSPLGWMIAGAAILLIASTLVWRMKSASVPPDPASMSSASIGPSSNASNSTARTIRTALRAAMSGSLTSSTSGAALVSEGSGVRGRLVSSSQAPVAGVEVRLLAVPPSFVDFEGLAPLETPFELERSRCTTDLDGKFGLPGGRRGELLALAIDCGGPRGCLRVVDGAPNALGELDLGELRLAPTITLHGRIVDQDGAVIPNARVRSQSVACGLFDTLGASTFAARWNNAWVIGEVPDWFVPWFDALPTPAVRSGSDGRFTLDVAGVSATLMIDANLHVTRRLDEPQLAGNPAELGDIVLSRGRTVHGRVVDSAGQPVQGAAVVVATFDPSNSQQVPMSSAAPTDVDGGFERAAVAFGEHVLVAARRTPTDVWTVREIEGETAIEVVLAPLARCEITLVDDQGHALEDVEVELHATTMPGFDSNPMVSATPPRTVASHHATFESLAPGTYRIAARAAGHASATSTLAITAPLTETTVVLRRATAHEIIVRDEATGENIAGADVKLVRLAPRNVLARVFTDAAGHAQLSLRNDVAAADVRIEVRHPNDDSTRVVELEFTATQQVITLSSGGAVLVRVLEGGAPSARRFTLKLSNSAHSRFPLLCSTDADGWAGVAPIAPGKWSYEISTSWRDEDALRLWNLPDEQPDALRRGEFQVTPSQLTQLTIELDPSSANLLDDHARVFGRFELGAIQTEDLWVEFDRQNGVHQHFECRVDAEGRFESGPIVAGDYRIALEYERGTDLEMLSTTPWSSLVKLAEGEVRELDVTLQRTLVRATVRDTSGALVEGASFAVHAPGRARLGSPWLLSDEHGIGEQLLYAPGNYIAVAEHSTLGFGHMPFEVQTDQAAVELELMLDPGVGCSGTVSAPQALIMIDSSGARWFHLSIRRVEDPFELARQLRLVVDANGQASFTLVGLTPGVHHFQLSSSSAQRAQTIVQPIGANGAHGIALTFELETP